MKIELFVFNTKLPEMAILASNDFTIAKILYSHALLIPTRSSKNEMVCQKKFKDSL